MNKKLALLGAAALLSLTASQSAFAGDGWYIGVAGGANWLGDVRMNTQFNPDTGFDTLGSRNMSFDTGWAVVASTGYSMSGFRVEFEGGFRHNNISTTSDVEVEQWSVMMNLLYDIQLAPSYKITIGGGAGEDSVHLKEIDAGFDDQSWEFAYQGIAGLSIALTKNVDFLMDYHYMHASGPDLAGRQSTPAGFANFALDDIVNHTATVGFRYSFGAEPAPPPPPPPVEAPPPPPAPEPPKAPKEFIVFFGHNMSDLTPEAVEVVKQAAEAAKIYGSANIAVVGHADRSGSDKYNIALSMKRATSVKAGLVTAGIAEAAIAIAAKGESEPLVPTDDGVREPQNRRVNITLP